MPDPPPPRKSYLRHTAVGLEHVFYRGSSYARKKFPHTGRVMLPEIYRAFSFPGHIDVKGRVLATRTLPDPVESDHWWKNGTSMARRWLTAECPHALVAIRLGSETFETTADDEGYFEMELPDPSAAETVEVWLPNSDNTAPVVENDPHPTVVVISDVDDTIFLSNTAKLLGMIKTALTGNALTRQIFPGVPDLYTRLRLGPHGDQLNPVSFVTSSPWNLHSFMKSIFDHRGSPPGALFMTDWGLSHDNWLKESNPVHKRRAILKILRWFPDSPVVLLGDNSQHDPEIYAKIAIEFPARIAAITIRDVTSASLPPSATDSSIPVLLHTDTSKAERFILEKINWHPHPEAR